MKERPFVPWSMLLIAFLPVNGFLARKTRFGESCLKDVRRFALQGRKLSKSPRKKKQKSARKNEKARGQKK